ncbi:MAG: hypothetical protein QME06_08915 [Desulfobacterales bacterium]|nr:hypothetical protein [Desulfobacterales bacterium]
MKFFKILTLLILCSFLWGCAVAPYASIHYSEPTTIYEISNEKKIDKPFEEVWESLVKNLSKSFFVINNIEKASRIINLSFSTDNPERYVDCWETTRTFNKGNMQKISQYEVASRSTYITGGTCGPYNNLPLTITVNRHPSLEGRVNIYIAPDGKGTIITVNTKYILSLDADGYAVAENAFGQVVLRENLPSKTPPSCSFNTKTTGNIYLNDPKSGDINIICSSKGVLKGKYWI